MEHGDEQARESLPQPGQRGPARSQAWRQLTCDYLNDLRRQLDDDVTGWLVTADHVALQRFAHRAKGTSGTFGLAQIAEKFAQLEQAAADRPPEHLAGLVVTLQQLIEVQTKELRPREVRSGGAENGESHD